MSLYYYNSRQRKKELPKPVMTLLEKIFGKSYRGNQVDAYKDYRTLKTRIRVLNTNTPEFEMISKYVKNTHGPTHNYTVTIEYVFKAQRLGEFQRYKPKMAFGNRKFLWHGSKRSNFRSILANGLSKQPPANVSTHGKMFGNGIYFADVVTKAAAYCDTSRSDPYGILILAEVALGRHYYLTGSSTVTALPNGKNSVKGLGRYKPDRTQIVRTEHFAQVPLGTLQLQNNLTTSLDYSEYIVYDDDQVFVEYLVLVKIL